jgi:hypothetical protein
MEILNPQTLADELAIRDLTSQFTDAVNRREPTALGALFVADGEWIVPGIPETRGPAAVTAVIDHLLSGFPLLVQLVNTGRVQITGDQATARWYLTEFARDVNGVGWSFVGYYHDRLIRTSGGWRFASRRFDFLYRGRTEVPGKATPFALPEPDGSPWPI